MSEKQPNLAVLDFTDLADLGLFQHAIRRGWPVPDEIRAKAANAVAGLVKDQTVGRRLRNRAEVVARLLGVEELASGRSSGRREAAR